MKSGGKSSKFMFRLETSQRIYNLYVETEAELKSWTELIGKILGKLKNFFF